MPIFQNPDYTLGDINDRLTALTIQKDETATRLLAFIKPLIATGVIKKSSDVGFTTDPNEWLKLGIREPGATSSLFVRRDHEGEKIYKRVQQMTKIMSNCFDQFHELVTKRAALIQKEKYGKYDLSKVRESLNNPEYTLDDINDRLTAVTIKKDETIARLEAYVRAATAKGLVKQLSEIEFHSEWKKLRGVIDRFVRNTDDGDKIYNHVLRLSNTIEKCQIEFSDLLTKRALLIRKAKAITENKEDPNVDDILYELIDMVNTGQKQNGEKFGMVAACIIDPAGHEVRALNYKIENDKHRVHAERAAIEKYMELYNEVPEG